MEAGLAQVENPILDTLKPHLSRSVDDERPVVLMMCGIAGTCKQLSIVTRKITCVPRNILLST